MRKLKFPKRAKLITDGGFSKIINIDEFTSTIHIPMIKNFTISSPETNIVDLSINFDIEFQFERATKTLAFYEQSNIINIIK